MDRGGRRARLSVFLGAHAGTAAGARQKLLQPVVSVAIQPRWRDVCDGRALHDGAKGGPVWRHGRAGAYRGSRAAVGSEKAGREVANFDARVWEAARAGIVFDGNFAKFSQKAALRKFLLGTGERVIVEASPVDRIWGVGLASDNPRIGDPSRWDGLNLLGFELMKVRTALRG